VHADAFGQIAIYPGTPTYQGQLGRAGTNRTRGVLVGYRAVIKNNRN